MNTYRLHIDSDLQGPWTCVIKAASVDDAIAYGEQVFQNAVVTVSKIADIPRKEPAPETPVPGFTRRELATITAALMAWETIREYWDASLDNYMNPQLGKAYHINTARGPNRDMTPLTIPETKDLQRRVWDTLTMEATDMDNPF